MPLPSNPDRDSIYGELAASTYRNGGTDTNGLKEMWAYVFGAGTYDRDSFGGYGKPVIASSITATGKDSSIDLTFTINNGGGHQMTFVAQYWEETVDASPSPYFEQEIGTGTGSGQYTETLTGLTNGTSYEVRVTAYNLWNNAGLYPAPRGTDPNYGWTSTATATPELPPLSQPSINVPASSRPNQNSVQRIYLDIQASGNQDDFTVELRINSSAETHSRSCSADLTTTTPEIIISSDLFFDTSDTVEVRLKATGAGFSDSSFSAWTTIPTDINTPSCPL